MPKTKRRPKRDDKDVQSLARRFFRLARLKKRAEARQKEVQGELLDELAARKLDKLTIGDTQITRVQAVDESWDVPCLHKVLKPRQRPVVLREVLDLNRLSDELRQRFVATLGAAERAAITSYEVNDDALAAEVAAGRIDADVVKACRLRTEKSPYIKVTDA